MRRDDDDDEEEWKEEESGPQLDPSCNSRPCVDDEGGAVQLS